MKISVIIPIHNEAEKLPALIAYLRETSDAEIIAVDGQSTDKSVSIVQPLADHTIELPRKGRSHQMHAGALYAKGDILLFLHADTKLPMEWEELILEEWAQAKKPAATAFTLAFDKNGFIFRLIALAASWRSRLTGIPHGDQAIAIDKEMYLAAGGFPDVPLMEEYILMKEIRKLGPVMILPQAALTSARRYEKKGPLYNALRNNLIILLYYLGVKPEKLARLYT